MLRQLATAALVLASATSVPAEYLEAQAPSGPLAGQRVRLHLTTGELGVDGWVARWIDDTLHLRQLVYRGSPDSLRYVPRATITSYQTSLGRDHGRGATRGAKVGVLVGGGIGVVLLALGINADRNCEDFCIATGIAAVLGAGTTLGGLVLGSLIGLLSAPERWSEPRPVP